MYRCCHNLDADVISNIYVHSEDLVGQDLGENERADVDADGGWTDDYPWERTAKVGKEVQISLQIRLTSLGRNATNFTYVELVLQEIQKGADNVLVGKNYTAQNLPRCHTIGAGNHNFFVLLITPT